MRNQRLLFTIIMSLLMSISAMAQTVVATMESDAEMVDLTIAWNGNGTVTANGKTLTNWVSTPNIPVVGGEVKIDTIGDVSIFYMDCNNNQLTSLDVSKLKELTSLNCYANKLTNLDLTGLTKLEALHCRSNKLTNLNISGLPNLTGLSCGENQLTSLDVSMHDLYSLDCESNQLTGLDVSGMTNLTRLNCTENKLTSLNLMNLTELTLLGCNNNQLTSLNVSNCTKLTQITANQNQLTSLNISGLTELTDLSLDQNKLTGLDVSHCTNLSILYCGNNQLTSLNIPSSLTELYCWNNKLTDLDVTSLTALTTLNCVENKLTSLDLSSCTQLTQLHATGQSPVLTQETTTGNSLTITNPISFNGSMVSNITGDGALVGNNITWTGLTNANGISKFIFSAANGSFTGEVTQPWVNNSPASEAVGFEFSYNGIMYRITALGGTPTVEVAENKNVSGNISIPVSAEYNGVNYDVTALGSRAFGWSDLKGISIPEGIKSIGDYAFSTTKIQSVLIPGSVEHIGLGVFYQSRSLDAITVAPNNAYYISENGVLFNKSKTLLKAFPNNKSGDYTIPGTVAVIENGAFDGGNEVLTSVIIPESVTDIGNYAFSGCSGLTSITVNTGNNNYSSESGVLFSKDKKTLLHYPQKKSDSEYSIPNTIETIDDYTFFSCYYLTTIVIPAGVKTIGSSFQYCTNLTEITCHVQTPINISFPTFEAINFSNCKLYVPANSVNAYKAADVWKNFGNNIETINETPVALGTEFVYNGIRYRIINNIVRTVEVAENPNASGNINIPANVEYNSNSYTVKAIGDRAFFDIDNLTGITFPSTLDSIGVQAFFGCGNLNNVILPEGLTLIKDFAFDSCEKLDSIIIPGSVFSIGHGAFLSCTNLKKIELPASLLYIGNQAFSYCYNLGKITCHIQSPITLSDDDDVFKDIITSDCKLYVPVNSVNAYKAADVWKDFDIRAIGNEDPEISETIITMESTASTIQPILFWDGNGTIKANGIPFISGDPIPVVNGKVELVATGDVKLNWLHCGNSQLTSLNVSKSVMLTMLDCTNNQLTSLDVSKLTKLTDLDCSNNPLTNLDISKLTELTRLNCAYNYLLSNLDVSTSVKLTELNCSHNSLTSLDVSALTELTKLECVMNQLNVLNVSMLTKLTELYCGSNQLQSLDVSALTKLKVLNCLDNQLTDLDVSACKDLERLDIGNNLLTSIDLSQCTELSSLYINSNPLTSINVSTLTKLTDLFCTNTPLTSLDISALTKLTSLHCSYNQLTSLDVSACTELEDLYCNHNQLTSLDVTALTKLKYLYASEQTITLPQAVTNGNNLTITNPIRFNGEITHITDGDATPDGKINWTGLTGTSGNIIFTFVTGLPPNLINGHAFAGTVTQPWIKNSTPTQQYAVSVSVNNNAYGTVSGSGTFNDGSSTTVTASANNGYQFVNWTEAGTQVSTNASYTFTVTGNRTLVANFESIPTTPVTQYTISVSANNSDHGTVSGGGTFNEGSSRTVTATANSGYKFVNWTEAGVQVSTNANYTFTVSKNRTLVANFETLTIVAEEPEPINDDNNGSIDFSLNIPADATITGSFEIKLPEGYTLDESATKLVESLAGKFDLIITFKGNNVWLIEIKSNGLRSASQATLTKIIEIVYTVDPGLKDGTYQIEIKNVDMQLSNGTSIEEDNITVPTQVARNTTGISLVEYYRIAAFVRGGNLIVRCNPNTTISVYSITGAQIKQIIAKSDETTIAIPKGLYIVRVGSKSIKIVNN